MSFLRQATQITQRVEHKEKTRESKKAGRGNKISSIWLIDPQGRAPESISIRLVEQESVTKDGQLLELGNPALVGKTIQWGKRNGKSYPEVSYLNPSTFNLPNPLDGPRREWFIAEKAKAPAGASIDSRQCPIPGTQDRYVIWGLITDASLQIDTRNAKSKSGKTLTVEDYLGFRYFDMGKDSWKSLGDCLHKAALRCEQCSKTLKIASVSCPDCGTELINEKDAANLPTSTLLNAGEQGLTDAGIDNCPNCSATLHQPLTISKVCSSHGEASGLDTTNANILITRTGEKSYAFEIDMDNLGPVEELPGDLLADIRRVELSIDPTTGATSTNLWGLDGASEHDLLALARNSVTRAPSSPLLG